jgi:hypothetical protein
MKLILIFCIFIFLLNFLFVSSQNIPCCNTDNVQSILTNSSYHSITFNSFGIHSSGFNLYCEKSSFIVENQKIYFSGGDIRIAYPNSFDTSLQVGIAGSELGSIIDLGTLDNIEKRYNIAPSVPVGSIFSSISFRYNQPSIMCNTASGYDYQTCIMKDEFNALYNPNPRSSQIMKLTLGNIYMLRIYDQNSNKTLLVAKFKVINLTKTQATIEYQPFLVDFKRRQCNSLNQLKFLN